MDQTKLTSDTETTIDRVTVVDNASEDQTRSTVSQPEVLPTSAPARPMQKGRFLSGMLLSSAGIGIMLSVAAGALQAYGVSGRMSLPAVGLCMIVGIMLLGGGFGIMATSASTFDDEEFERLMNDGDAARPSAIKMDGVGDLPAFRQEPERITAEQRKPSEQVVA